jgi:two-component system CheB/CheR fusion protein
LLHSYAPASVTTDVQGNVLYVHGDTGRYLLPAPGPVSNNVVEMARAGLEMPLRSALLQAMLNHTSTVDEQVSVKTNGGFSQVRFTVQRLPAQISQAHLLLISFRDVASPGATTDAHPPQAAPTPEELSRVQQLELKLAYANETLNHTLEEQQAFNEELKSTNEELQSSNEELETSKEELQSLNEETITVNAELNARIHQLTSVQNDMKNLMDSIDTGTVFLDHQRVIRRYTPTVANIYRLIPTDVGRPLSDITSSLGAELHKSLQNDLQSVLDTLVPIEREVESTDGAWYLARIQPYRTLDNVIEGVVLEHHFKSIGHRRISLSARRIDATPGQTAFILLSLTSILATGNP